MQMKEHIRLTLSNLEPRTLTKGFRRQAAVLIPVYEREGECHLLLTRRTDQVETHKGQISFPGGMQEEGEDLLRTALRETYEEVGIAEDRVEVLGRFHDYVSITEYRVTPFAAFLRAPFTVRPQEREVAEILHVPFGTFLDPERLRTGSTAWGGRQVKVYYYSYGAHQIWGLTARIIKEFFDTLKLRSPQPGTP
ncbi:MAG: CoA pyrophosphatase [Acidobacteria bacterium]|nr:CoA pyrophosphatase [Acidobacteriota bacterium]